MPLTPKSARRRVEVRGSVQYTPEDIRMLRFLIPRGVIVAWSGSAAAIPEGWSLCNGSNSTPDLQNRFIYGGSTLGSTGGAATHTHDDHASHTHDDASELGTPQLFTRDPAGVSARTGGPSATLTHSSASSLPPYYQLAFIMKL